MGGLKAAETGFPIRIHIFATEGVIFFASACNINSAAHANEE